jgi:hypothetical protein
MAGLLNIVPRYLPRYGMAPDWTRAIRPLVIVFSVIAFIVTVIFRANVNAQGGAYATGVLVLMSSGAVAVTLAAWRSPRRKGFLAYLAITLVFIYTAIANMIERPDGLKIAAFFIFAIIAVSMLSRVMRTTELRDTRIELDEEADRFIREDRDGEIHVIANKRQKGDLLEYELKEKEQREDNHIPPDEQILFLEVTVCDASEFASVMKIRGVQVGPYQVLRAESSAVPNAIAAFLLYLRDRTGKIPHAYFSWSEGNPIKYLISYIFLGEGDTAPLTHEVLRVAEKNPDLRPAIHVGG